MRYFIFGLLLVLNFNLLNAGQIESIKIHGTSFFQEQKIFSLIQSRWNIDFDSLQAAEDCESIRQFYQDEGFLEVQCYFDVKKIYQKRGDQLTFMINEGSLYRFGDIKISGLSVVQSSFVAHLIEFSGGMPFSKKKIVRSQLRAMQTGLFNDFEIKARYVDSFEKTISILIEIEEKKLNAFDIGMGVDSEDGADIFSGWHHRNLNGNGRSLEFSGMMAVNYAQDLYFKKAGIGGTLREPFFLELPLDAVLNSGYTTDKPTSSNFGFKSYVTEVILDIPVSLEYEMLLRGKVQNAQLFNLDSDTDTRSFQERFQIDNNRFLSFTVSRDTRDDLVDPSGGSYLSVTLEKAGGLLGGDNDYNKIYFLGSWYGTIHRRLVVAQQIAYGQIELNGELATLPSYLRFFLGGSGSVRGFTHRSLGPRNDDGSAAGGNSLFLGNFELRYYINYNFSLVTFLDVGNVWLNRENSSLGTVNYSTGLGLRLRTQFGFFRLDAGIKLSNFLINNLGRIHFGFGQTF